MPRFVVYECVFLRKRRSKFQTNVDWLLLFLTLEKIRRRHAMQTSCHRWKKDGNRPTLIVLQRRNDFVKISLNKCAHWDIRRHTLTLKQRLDNPVLPLPTTDSLIEKSA